MLNIISTLIEHPNIDTETVSVLLSSTLKYKKFSDGVILGRSIFKLDSIKLIMENEDERERCIILFLENLLGVLQMEANHSGNDENREKSTLNYNCKGESFDNFELMNSSLNSISLQNSLEDILDLSTLTIDFLKCFWDI